jgi:hypothetical protein
MLAWVGGGNSGETEDLPLLRIDGGRPGFLERSLYNVVGTVEGDRP